MKTKSNLIVAGLKEYYIDFDGLLKKLGSCAVVGNGDGETRCAYAVLDAAARGVDGQALSDVKQRAFGLERDSLFARESVEYLVHELNRVKQFVEGRKQLIWSALVNLVMQLHLAVDGLAGGSSGDSLSVGRQTLDLRKGADCVGGDLVQLDAFIRQNIALGGRVACQLDGCNDTAAQGSHFMLVEQCIKGVNRDSEGFLDPLMLGLSDLYQCIRIVEVEGANAKNVLSGVSQTRWQAPKKFTRVTKKFWILPRNVARLKAEIVKHLPILVYGERERITDVDAMDLSRTRPDKVRDSGDICSVYFDNIPDLENYHERLHRRDQASVIRLRWYGSRGSDDPEKQIFVEKKVHRSAYTGLSSSKERGELQQKDVLGFLSGTLDIPQNASDGKFLAQVMKEIRDTSQVPLMRTSYSRTAFQKSSENIVRISLDTKLCMIKEYPKDGPYWCRDIGLSPLYQGDVVQFPYGVVEIKLQSSPPDWVKKLVKTGILLVIPKFSKFLHGTASLYQEHVDNVPYWFLPNLENPKGHLTPATWAEMEDNEDVYAKDAADWLFPHGFEVPAESERRLSLPFLRPKATRRNSTGQEESKKAMVVSDALGDINDESGNRTWCDAEELDQSIAVSIDRRNTVHVTPFISPCLDCNDHEDSRHESIVDRRKTWPVHQSLADVEHASTSSDHNGSHGFVSDSARHKSHGSSTPTGSLSSCGNEGGKAGDLQKSPFLGMDLEAGIGGKSNEQMDWACGPKHFSSKLTHMESKQVDTAAYSVMQYTLSCPDRGQSEEIKAGSGAVPNRAKSVVRTRVEPKTFFANERTFLQWLNISVLVMFLALSLLSGSSIIPGTGSSLSSSCSSDDHKCIAGKMSGAIIAPVALSFMAYALYMYKKRTIQILRRETVRYDDQRGPVVLVVILLLVMTISYILTMIYVF
eukprot:jgi/Picsp_1/3460/NSC_06298-R1_vacuolar transporter chaperone 4